MNNTNTTYFAVVTHARRKVSIDQVTIAADGSVDFLAQDSFWYPDAAAAFADWPKIQASRTRPESLIRRTFQISDLKNPTKPKVGTQPEEIILANIPKI